MVSIIPDHSVRTLMAPTPSPSIADDPWAVGAQFATFVDDVYRVEAEIGRNIGPDSVTVSLYDFDCVTLKNSTGLAVSLEAYPYDPNANFIYDIGIDETLFPSNEGGFVTVSEENPSTGRIEFCTRISALVGSLEVSHKTTKFSLSFDYTNNNYNVGGVEIEEEEREVFITNLDGLFNVRTCQCSESDIACEQSVVNQADYLYICLEPASLQADAGSVRIQNFNVLISAGVYGSPDYISYFPVVFGRVTWDPDTLTRVTEEELNVVKVRTLILPPFYQSGKATVDVTGNAFLEFVGSAERRKRPPFFTQYVINVAIYQDFVGCFAMLIQRMLQFF